MIPRDISALVEKIKLAIKKLPPYVPEITTYQEGNRLYAIFEYGHGAGIDAAEQLPFLRGVRINYGNSLLTIDGNYSSINGISPWEVKVDIFTSSDEQAENLTSVYQHSLQDLPNIDEFWNLHFELNCTNIPLNRLVKVKLTPFDRYLNKGNTFESDWIKS